MLSFTQTAKVIGNVHHDCFPVDRINPMNHFLDIPHPANSTCLQSSGGYHNRSFYSSYDLDSGNSNLSVTITAVLLVLPVILVFNKAIKRSRRTSKASVPCEVKFTAAESDKRDPPPLIRDTSCSKLWSNVPAAEPDKILGIAAKFRACTNPNKVNVCVGAYRDAIGKPWVLPTVKAAEQKMLNDETAYNKEYLPIEGDSEFLKVAVQFAYGTDSGIDLSKVAAIQTLSGTGACKVGGEFLKRYWKPKRNPNPTLYIPIPTWSNHWKIFQGCGLPTAGYRYYNSQTNKLDLAGLLEDLENAPDESIILLHACAHNPTGCDPTDSQWQQIRALLKQKNHLCFFDSAYQGFASGDAERDAVAFREAVNFGLPCLLAQSFAKNFGLYGERVGSLSVVCTDTDQRDKVISQLKAVVRPMYSSPPGHGSNIVKIILTDVKLSEQYKGECKIMADRIALMRTQLVERLEAVGSTHDWSHVRDQIGMFAYTGCSEEMCDALTNEYAIFLTRNGRISLAGLNEQNLDYVAIALHRVTEGKSIIG